MTERILLPTDGTPGTDRAIEHAIDVADRDDASLHVLYVVDAEAYGSYSGDEYVHEFEGLEAALERTGRAAVDEIVDTATDAGIEATGVVRHGTPHEEILEYVDEADIDLVVVGSKRRSGEYRRLLGSVADRVARLSAVPVTIVKTPVEP